MKLSHISLAVLSAIALAACGGSGSSNQVTASNGGNNDVKDKKEEDKVVVSQPKLSEKVKVEFDAAVTGLVDDESVDAGDFPGGEGDKKINFFKPNGDLVALTAGSVAFVNPDLYNDKGKLKLEAGYVTTVTKDAKESDVVLYKDGKKFKKAWAAKADNGNFYFFKEDDKPAQDETADASKALKADELYQAVNNDFVKVEGINVLGQEVKTVYGLNGTDVLEKIDRSKIETGKIISAPLTASVEANDYKLAPAKELQNVAESANGYQDATNLDGDKELLKSVSGNVKIGDVKAYNLPYSFVSVSAKADKTVAADFAFKNGDAKGNFVTGLDVVVLPENVKADYKGKAFSMKSEGDITLSVSFKEGEKAVVDSIKIDNRKAADGSVLNTLVSEAPVGIASANDEYTSKLVKESDSAAQSNEIKTLKGKFYGVNAEETAGKLYSTNAAAAGDEVGVYAAQK